MLYLLCLIGLGNQQHLLIKTMKKNNSFTLVELLVVIIIVGILAAVAIPMYSNAVEQKKGEVCINNIRMIFAAEKIYRMKNNNLWPNSTSGYVQQTITQINSALGINISDSNFNYYFSHLTGSNSLYVYGSRISGSHLGQFIWYYGNVTSTSLTWAGTWFTTGGFQLPTD